MVNGTASASHAEICGRTPGNRARVGCCQERGLPSASRRCSEACLELGMGEAAGNWGTGRTWGSGIAIEAGRYEPPTDGAANQRR